MHGCYANLTLSSRRSREAVAKYFFRVVVEAACTVVVEEFGVRVCLLNTSAVAEMKIGDAGMKKKGSRCH